MIHFLVYTGLATPVRGANLVGASLPQDETNIVRQVSSALCLLAGAFQARFPVTFGWEQERPFTLWDQAGVVPSRLQQRLTRPGLRASISRRGVRCLQSSPFDGRVIIFSADGRPMVGLERSWSGTRYPLAEPRAGSTLEWSLWCGWLSLHSSRFSFGGMQVINTAKSLPWSCQGVPMAH